MTYSTTATDQEMYQCPDRRKGEALFAEKQPASRHSITDHRRPGFGGHPWIRFNNEFLGITGRAVMFDVAELRGAEYEPAALGMVRMKDQSGPFEIPVIDVVVDMKSRYDIDLYEVADAAARQKPIIGGAFKDSYPDDFWNQIHQQNALVLLAGDTPAWFHAVENAPDRPFDLKTIIANSYIAAAAGLMVRAYDSGVGTAMPGA